MATTRRPARGGQLLLLAALLLGIVTMHTLGHPTGHGGDSEQASQATRATQIAQLTQVAQASARHETSGSAHGMSGGHATPPEPVGHIASDPVIDPASDPLTDPPSAADPAGHGGMDPLSVCLAVLGAFTLLLLLKAGLLRPGGFAVAVRTLARLLDGLRPNPPPPRILLARLSVLRI
ncbi:hypothetical protein ACIBKX_02795 [Streptomyces sp. NPDC050658]|uniref:hypothetical protein n=1 Tax=unclassified Streptomyces TaxID=2593676 RepID=UPI0034289F56